MAVDCENDKLIVTINSSLFGNFIPLLSIMNKISMSLVLATVCLLSNTQVMAADSCDDPQTQAAMNQCALNNYKDENTLLNQTYQSLRSQLTTQEKSQLKSAQLAWISYRDKSCEFTTRNSVGGSIHSLEKNLCLSQMTAVRRGELELELEIESLKSY